MVSSPVSDLLNESKVTESSQEETFEQENTLENEEGNTLEIYRFLDDGVKMVSVNGYKLPLGTLLEMVGFDERVLLNETDYTVADEDDTCQIAIFILFMISISGSALCFFFAIVRTYHPNSL
jgi:hypothetical protein